MNTIIWDTSVQGSEAWLALRARGFITGSRAKDARAKTAKGLPTATYWTYAYDTARQREGGSIIAPGSNAAMRMGTEQEPIARMLYEARTGELVEEVGFAYTHDGKFGCSADGLVGTDGAIEVKTMVGSTTLFGAMVDGDISEYRDQCLMAMWLLGRKWVDVVLWAPDLQMLRVTRVERDEAEIEAFVADMLAFDQTVEGLRVKLRAVREQFSVAGVPMPLEPEPAAPAPTAPAAPAAVEPPAPAQAKAQVVAPDAMPELF
jgi:exodeoxyribonuclease (lambda-induced)